MAPTAPQHEPPPAAQDPVTTNLWRRAARVPWWLRLIALGKLAKGCGFLVLGLAAARVARLGVEDTVALWLTWVHLDPQQNHSGKILEWLRMAEPKTLREFGLGFFVYSAVLFIEAVGLWFDRGWAEWLVIGVATALVPFEVYEIIAHPTTTRICALGINLVIVAALGWRLRAKHRKPAVAPG